MKLTALTAALLTALVLGLAACGGDDDAGEEAATPPPAAVETDAVESARGEEAPSKREYVAAAGDVCAAYEEALAERQQEAFTEDATEEDFERFIQEEFVPSAEALAEDLRELTPPEGDEQEVEEMYDALDEGIETLREEGLTLGSDPFAEADNKLRDYGLLACIGEGEGQGPGQGQGQGQGQG